MSEEVEPLKTNEVFVGEEADKLAVQANFLAAKVEEIATPIETQEEFAQRSEVLSQLKRLNTQIENERKRQNEPAQQEIKDRNAEAKILTSAIEEGIALLNPHVLQWLKDHPEGDNQGKLGSTTSKRETWTYEVKNWRKVPARFLSIIAKEVNAIIKEVPTEEREDGKEIPGIPGVVFKLNEGVTSRRN